VSRIRKKTFFLQLCMRTPEGHQKSIFNTSKVKKKTKIHMGFIRQCLQAQPKKIKNVIETPNQPIEIKKISNKSVLYFKSEKNAKIRMGATRRSLQAQPKILKKLSVHQVKKKRSQKFVWELPDGICRLNSKS
jgi:hypothetical protein